jgi:hypothetical protein
MSGILFIISQNLTENFKTDHGDENSNHQRTFIQLFYYSIIQPHWEPQRIGVWELTEKLFIFDLLLILPHDSRSFKILYSWGMVSQRQVQIYSLFPSELNIDSKIKKWLLGNEFAWYSQKSLYVVINIICHSCVISLSHFTLLNLKIPQWHDNNLS